jgi:hypothetical protein
MGPSPVRTSQVPKHPRIGPRLVVEPTVVSRDHAIIEVDVHSIRAAEQIVLSVVES